MVEYMRQSVVPVTVVWTAVATALFLTWGAVMVVATLVLLGAYALLRAPVLLTVHDNVALLAAVLTLAGFAVRSIARRRPD